MLKQNHIKIGVIGLGHLGSFHVEQLSTIDNVELVGVFDSNKKQAEKVGLKFNVSVFKEPLSLMKECEAVSIVTPTSTHYSIAKEALGLDCHLFIEKPITEKIHEAEELLKIAEAKKKVIQVGHIERFNPAFIYVKSLNIAPQFIEIHRLSPFNPRGTDVPVILDLMIHDLDLLLNMIDSKPLKIEASGVKVVSETIDIANARVSFNNGCVANITASRISQGSMRKMRIFQEQNYITVDFLQNSVEIYNVQDSPPKDMPERKIFPIEGHNKKYIVYEKPEIIKHNALREELYHFSKSIAEGEKPKVDGHSAAEALSLALKIQKIIDGK